MPVTMTLVSEMGRQVVDGRPTPLPACRAGDYEVFAEAPTELPPGAEAGRLSARFARPRTPDVRCRCAGFLRDLPI